MTILDALLLGIYAAGSSLLSFVILWEYLVKGRRTSYWRIPIGMVLWPLLVPGVIWDRTSAGYQLTEDGQWERYA